MHYSWLFPFILFLTGYYITDHVLYVPSIETPALLGKNIGQATSILSNVNLNIRIIQEKKDNDLPDGTIIHQSPAAHQQIKTNQTVFCVLSRQSQTKTAPDLLGKTTDQINEILAAERIRTKIYSLPNNHKEGTCIAQFPEAQEPLTQRAIMLYSSAGNKKAVLFPCLKGKLVSEVQEFFALHGITSSIFHQQLSDKNHQCSTCRVIEQKPLPGSIIDLGKPLHVQLQVE